MLYNLDQDREQFLVANVVPGFKTSVDCSDPEPWLIERVMTNFDNSWKALISAQWRGKRAHSAYVMYNNDGEDAGIEPAAAAPPRRSAGYDACGGMIVAEYMTYPNPSDGNAYLHRNYFWASLFKALRRDRLPPRSRRR